MRFWEEKNSTKSPGQDFVHRVAQKLANSWSTHCQLPTPWEVAGVFLAVVLWQGPCNQSFSRMCLGSSCSVVSRSLGNGVRKNGVRNRCPYRRCGVDTEIPYQLPFWRVFCWFLHIRVASRVDTAFPYWVRIVDRGVDCRDPVCRHRFRFSVVSIFFCYLLKRPGGSGQGHIN